MSSRDSFLARVRESVAKGNQAGRIPPLPERHGVGYQGAGNDPIQRFCEELAAVGGIGYVVNDHTTACAEVVKIISAKQAKSLLLGSGKSLDSLDLKSALEDLGCDVLMAKNVEQTDYREMFRADVGISPVEYLIAETGSIVVASKPDDPRSVSLLPPVHIAVACETQILPDLFDLFDRLNKDEANGLPSGISFITGPSKTGDIELKLVTGVHGPGEVHVVIIRN